MPEAASLESMRQDVLAGLRGTPKRLSSKYFYDARGSKLFEQITRTPEYYLTRVECDMLRARGTELAAAIGPRAHVVEYGSGSGDKTRLLLRALDDVVAYTPVEISRSALADSVGQLAREFPDLEMLPLPGDFQRTPPLPRPRRAARRRLLFFPGSTIGNFRQEVAVALLRAMHATLGADGVSLIGFDLIKDPAVIEAAYNDSAGITAEFTLNLLLRLNRELDADFDLGGFAHHARYETELRRIETALVSRRTQQVRVGAESFYFADGEPIEVEISQKYDDGMIAELASAAGLRVVAAWNGPRDWFGLRLLGTK
ncbi:MAG TPA: L-histidine N(alpha)-methyltransferase [Xanthomonadaceae bacterium]|nr:L-histidine N(alpha)-methyltransferase [Xanthomonadaceae bacterium]